MAVSPAAGPDTEIGELLRNPTTIPPIIPAMIPDKGGAPEANAIPKHKGRATKKTTNPGAKFLDNSALIFENFIIIAFKINNKVITDM